MISHIADQIRTIADTVPDGRLTAISYFTTSASSTALASTYVLTIGDVSQFILAFASLIAAVSSSAWTVYRIRNARKRDDEDDPL